MADYIHTAADLVELQKEVKADVRFAAFEESMFMGGTIVPTVNTPNGSKYVSIPVLGTLDGVQQESFDGATLTGWGAAGAKAKYLAQDQISAEEVIVRTKLFGNSIFLRDGDNYSAFAGREAGRSIARVFDTQVCAHFDNFTTAIDSTGATLTSSDILKAAATLRQNAIGGNFVAVFSPSAAAGLIEELKTAAYAGGSAQDRALGASFIGSIHGVDIFQSTYCPEAAGVHTGVVMSREAMVIAMRSGLTVEAERESTAVGTSFTAHMQAGHAIVRNAYGVKVLSDGLV